MKIQGAVKAVQIIGTQRSGSNLLRLMLNQLDGVFAPHPPHILSTFLPLIPHYGDLRDEAVFMQMVDDVCRLVELNPVPWIGIRLDRSAIVRSCHNRTLVEVFRRVYESGAAQHSAGLWCCKSMQNVHHLDLLTENGLDPFLIFLYRDGRDVALSFRKAIVGPKHIYHIARQWHEEQELALRRVAQAGPERAIAVRYEDLLRQPGVEMHRICSFLGLPYSEKVLEYYRSEESHLTAGSGAMWRNVVLPIIPDNFNKYLREMPEEDIRLFEKIAGHTLRELGYPLACNGIDHPAVFPAALIQEYDLSNEELMQRALRKASRLDIEKRHPQQEFMRRLRQRLEDARSTTIPGS
jgi:hypothetical protein